MKPTSEAYEKGLTTVRKKQKGRTPKTKKLKKKNAQRSKEVNNAENLSLIHISAKITGAGAKNIAILLYSILKEEKKTCLLYTSRCV